MIPPEGIIWLHGGSNRLGGLQGCYALQPPRSVGDRRGTPHEERKFRYSPKHKVCDALGNKHALRLRCRGLPSYGWLSGL